MRCDMCISSSFGILSLTDLLRDQSDRGLLCSQDAHATTFVEYGAGKGYLSSMLSDLSQACDFILMDNQSFRHKAER